MSKYAKVYCELFTAVNEAEETMLFQCPANAYIAGLKSVLDPAVSEADRV